MSNIKIRNAIISCYDKTNLKPFVEGLVNLNPSLKIFASSGTFKELQVVAKENLVAISEYVGFKEMPNGLVKTLHPKIHSGILADLSDTDQSDYLKDNNIVAFDLVVVNLYPFKHGSSATANFASVVKNMDIGGVSLLEAGAKNLSRVAVVSSVNEYDAVISTLKKNAGCTDIKLRLNLAKKTMSYLQDYVNAIALYYDSLDITSLEK